MHTSTSSNYQFGRRGLAKRESQLKINRGNAQWFPKLGMIGIFAFIILTLINIGISILRLEDHRVLLTQGRMVPEPMYPESGISDRTSASWQRPLLPPSIWSTRKLAEPVDISPYLSTNQTEKAKTLCGKFIYSTLQRAVRAGDLGQEVFVGK